jgi:hypothetical protein
LGVITIITAIIITIMVIRHIDKVTTTITTRVAITPPLLRPLIHGPRLLPRVLDLNSRAESSMLVLLPRAPDPLLQSEGLATIIAATILTNIQRPLLLLHVHWDMAVTTATTTTMKKLTLFPRPEVHDSTRTRF